MFKVLKFKRTRIVAMFLAALMVLPLAAALSPAEARPPSHAPAWGYRRKEHKERRTTWRPAPRRTTTYWRRERRTTTYRPTYRTRYRTQYRTRYNRYGRPYREYYRVYY